MNGDSDFLDIDCKVSDFKVENGPELIHSSKNSLIFRIRKDGKYFLLKRSATQGERGQRILRREYELSVGCDHPNIVDVYDYRKLPENQSELVMEYVDGRTLTYFMEENPPHKTKKKVFSELLEAVAYLHKKRIIHNDLKPENILISRNGDHVKLIDLGLSDDDAHWEIKTPGCSAAYAAPELKEDRKSDARSDIYSLGMIMRDLFGNRYSVISNKCLRKDPNKRFQDVGSLKHRWKKGFMRLLIPAVAMFILIMIGGLSYLVADNHKRDVNIKTFQSTIENHSQELKEQFLSQENLELSYAQIKESIEKDKINEENKKSTRQKILDSFKNGLSVLTKKALDSIRNCQYPNDMVPIYQNYSRELKKLYDEELVRIKDEELHEDITSLMNKEFSVFDVEFKKSLEKTTERITESLLNPQSEQ